MTRNIITLFAITAFTTSTAYAGSNCGKYKSASMQQPTIKPAIMSHNWDDSTSRGNGFMYAKHHEGDTSKYDGNLMYQMAAKNKFGSDVVDTAIAAGSFKTLVKAVQAAGLVDTLKGDGPYTVFAPTDEAFAKLPQGTLKSLLADKQKLTEVLTYHVVSGKVMASDLIGKESIDSIQGSAIASASLQVSKADIMASNGVIHVIDEVLIP